MKITVETITPQLATELLNTNTKNRPLNQKHVQFLSDQMRSGNWQMAADPIRISETNVLLDGQHRLSALVRSETTLEMVVVRNLPDSTFHVMDTGRMRLASDVLSIAGVPNSRLAASIARMVINYDRSLFGNVIKNPGRAPGLVVTSGEILDFMAGKDLNPYLLQAKIWYKQWPMYSGSEYGFFYFILSRIDDKAAFEFLNALSLGANLSEQSPIFQIRKRMEQCRIGKKISNTPTEKLGLVLKAWNLYRKGKTVSYLSFNLDKEDVPTPV